MKNTIFITLLMIALAIAKGSNAQVGIGVSTVNINRLAQLDVTSTTKGFMPPRMNYQERNLLLVTSESAGLIIYCTDCGSNGGEPECYNGSAWASMIGLQGSLPTLAPTSTITAISAESATSGGNILTDGGATVCFRGVCWSTSSNPTIALSTKTVDGTGRGSFTSSITGLTGNTTYYVRSYATNAAGTAYGNELAFTLLPTISTSTISNIGYTSATCGGTISAGGNATVTARGVCWSTNSNPNVALNTKTVDGTGMGSFTSSITGLTENTTYYVRSYATNAIGTAYGNEVVFTSLSLSVPTISTSTISNIGYTSATCGGTIGADGNATITARGVCWSTSSNPTIALSTKTVDGTGIGSFTSSITGLTENTIYYVRSYATNAIGTAYGNEVVFTAPLDLTDLTPRVTIGTQMWTTQNLNVSNYRDGTPIPKVEDAATWAGLTTGAYCYYNNDSTTYASIYGKLYNWYAVAGIYDASSLSDSSLRKNLAPAGYKIPTDYDWTILTETLGANNATQMRSTSGWSNGGNGSNSSGFAGLPGGYRYDGNYSSIVTDGAWWSSTENGTANVWFRYLTYYYSWVSRNSFIKKNGLSVRSIKD